MTENASPEVLAYLTRGIQAEIAAYVFYKVGSKIVKDNTIKFDLLTFAGEERKHFLALERQYDQYVRSEKWVTYRDIMSKDGLPEISEDMGEKHVRRISRVREAKNTMDVLNLALELEKEAHALYSEALKNSDTEEVRRTFEFLVNFELGHIRLIETMIAAQKE